MKNLFEKYDFNKLPNLFSDSDYKKLKAEEQATLIQAIILSNFNYADINKKVNQDRFSAGFYDEYDSQCDDQQFFLSWIIRHPRFNSLPLDKQMNAMVFAVFKDLYSDDVLSIVKDLEKLGLDDSCVGYDEEKSHRYGSLNPKMNLEKQDKATQQDEKKVGLIAKDSPLLKQETAPSETPPEQKIIRHR